MPVPTRPITGMCVSGRYELATRNVDDFSTTELTLIKPFRPEPSLGG